MTFSNQEVPTWELFQESMYDLNLPEVIEDTEQCYTDNIDIKIEDTYSPMQYQTPGSSMLGSPVMNMPILCRPYNPYSPAPQAIQSLASPSNSFVNSPGDSSTYSASPISSPQQPFPSEEFMRYGMRQGYQARHPMVPTTDYGYYYGDYPGLKRKRPADHELTPEEYEKRRVRRERNKQAALRCRTRRRERIDALEQETSQIEEENEKVEKEILGLKKQIEELQGLLKEHDCKKHIDLTTDSTPQQVSGMKVE